MTRAEPSKGALGEMEIEEYTTHSKTSDGCYCGENEELRCFRVQEGLQINEVTCGYCVDNRVKKGLVKNRGLK